MHRSIDEAEERIRVLEKLISSVRHDVNGALTPALMAADSLRSHADQRVALAGSKIADSVLRVTKLLRSTRDTVPSMQGRGQSAGLPGAALGQAGLHGGV